MGNKDVKIICLLIGALFLSSPFIEAKHIQSKKSSLLAKPPKGTTKTIRGDDGDVVDCVNIYKQPALKKHQSNTIQMKPSFYHVEAPSSTKGLPLELAQSWHTHGRCPDGTIPIRRQLKVHPSMTLKRTIFPSQPTYTTDEYHYDGPQWLFTDPYVVTGYYPDDWPSNHGAHVTFNIWKPKVARSTDWSQANMIFSAEDGDENQSILNVGWIVYPALYGDDMPRLSVCGTTMGKTLCDLDCFVQTSNEYAIGGAFTPSTYEGPQSEIDVIVHLDNTSGNWWLLVQNQPIGYWLNDTVSILQYGANFVYWRGDIYDSTGNRGANTSTQMGSGHFATEGYAKAADVRNMRYINTSGAQVQLTMDDFSSTLDNLPSCYNYMFNDNNASNIMFFYGGPGCG
ncbi:hypothetical protein Ancab_029380 [Ancistrocladus abbreviatus]